MTPALRTCICGLSLGFSTLLTSPTVQARMEERLSYSKTQSFRCALRFLRVDHGYEVVEKDAESGYLLFQYPLRNSEVTQGSIEVVERANSVSLVVQLPQMPSYHERVLIEGLLKKLRQDYGAPPATEKPPSKEAPPAKEPDSKDANQKGERKPPSSSKP